MDKEMMNMMDTVTKSLDLLVQTQRSTQEFMKSQLDVNKMLIERIKRLEAKTNVVQANEPIVVNEIFDNMINRFKNEEKNAKKN
jgi:isopentenyl diphosphate isomerase/L-lactate dehydrogenase-like FMN-dependent dehydrogenase|tara:strand:+ start:102 stop:353 length:252 start_codon:yes stop_codon:yes gene_type:complete